jgi:NAD(P)-dependent dehydrogenase (short-subunit alcohol dehydrogenase family)
MRGNGSGRLLGDVTSYGHDITGRTVLVTGATDGLGRALARALVDAGASVLVHGRNPERIAATADELRRAAGEEGRVRSYQADFASLAQVRDMADELLAAEPRLDVLVNNAGIGTNVPGGGERMESADRYELRFAVNYLAGHLLTERLLDLLARSAPARVVNVSSAGQMPLDFDDLMLERSYDGVRAYGQSKLAQIMQAIDLSERLDPAQLTANALHPATYMPTKIVPSPMSTLEEGVDATLRLVADDALTGVPGRYFDGQREAAAHPQAYDSDARARLAATTNDLIEAALDH